MLGKHAVHLVLCGFSPDKLGLRNEQRVEIDLPFFEAVDLSGDGHGARLLDVAAWLPGLQLGNDGWCILPAAYHSHDIIVLTRFERFT